jgi:hypothetical protein
VQQLWPRYSPNPGTTKLQKQKLDLIREFVEERSYEEHGGFEWEQEHLEWGPMSVTVRTNPDTFQLRGRYHVLISRRGKAKVMSAGGFGYPDSHSQHFASMIKGHDETDS